MATRQKIDSNETNAYYAEETSIGVLPVTPAWKPLEPNSYSDFGGQTTLLARNPINSSRQRKKGVITDLDASGGINQDFTQTNFQDLLQGVMFADTRTKSSYTHAASAGDLSVTYGSPDEAWPAIVGEDFEGLGLIPGEWIYVSGFTNAENNGFKRIHSFIGSPSTGMFIDRSAEAMIDEAAAAQTVTVYMGKVLKNETGSLVKRRSYQIERQLGAPDSANLNQIQAEYLKGAIPNEFTLNIEQADKINADLSFVAIDNEQRSATTGIKPGTRAALVETDAFNTSSDFSSLKMAIITDNETSPSALFGYLTELSITINNNVSPNKAVAVLGAFDVTAGTFEVSGSATAYFSTIEATEAVRQNKNVNIHAIVCKDNAGFILDLPLIALGDARLDVEQDEPITLPLAMDAATAAGINSETDYTAMFVFFDTLPDDAMPQ